MLSVGDIAQVSRVCSIMAAFASLGSIATGVFFVWRHQRDTRVSATRTVSHLFPGAVVRADLSLVVCVHEQRPPQFLWIARARALLELTTCAVGVVPHRLHRGNCRIHSSAHHGQPDGRRCVNNDHPRYIPTRTALHNTSDIHLHQDVEMGVAHLEDTNSNVTCSTPNNKSNNTKSTGLCIQGIDRLPIAAAQGE